ncbi:RloB family protein [Halosquirtibacter xylanolyticus]|uniref:RloB family protein n=1 Tax=Halosquirtibacter xylanolyticus TaxID=3374599 RepID=UPI003749D9DD|nr:RloB family protein [Prolixibacteraceae bacterium]
MRTRLRVQTSFGERKQRSETVEPKNIYIISIVGEGKTEEDYFDGLKDSGRTGLVKIERLEKEDETDTKSHPKYVYELLEERSTYWQEHGVAPYELWMVVDRDKGNVSESQLKEIIRQCEERGYGLAISNPTFELWLLLHLTDKDAYDEDDLYENRKVNKQKRFLEKALADLLGGYRKSNFKFDKFQSGINDAIVRGKAMPSDNDELVDKLGTSVWILVDKILQ